LTASGEQPDVQRTARLELVPGSPELLRAELRGRDALAAVLGADVPASWPPELYDADAIGWMLARLEQDAAYLQWGFRYFVLRDDARRVAVGAGGYKGPPGDAREVEIGYSVLPEFRRRGFAREASAALVEHAFASGRVDRVIAETLPELTPSIGVLESLGFTLVSDGSEPGVIRFALARGAP